MNHAAVVAEQADVIFAADGEVADCEAVAVECAAEVAIYVADAREVTAAQVDVARELENFARRISVAVDVVGEGLQVCGGRNFVIAVARFVDVDV